jgi:4-hydroxy-4-methyl-2-oxoglutarate aldolase
MDDVVRGLSELSTPTISDALDRLGIAGQAEGIYPVDRGFRLAGRAFTVLYQPIDTAGGTVGDFIDDVPPGEVVVLDNSGRLDATIWGDIMTLVARRRGLGGTVINGICRDSDRALKVGYPLFSKSHWMRTGKDRVMVAGQQVPVVLGGVRVRPGDVLIGDSDGVVVVPAEREAEVLAVAAEIEKAEEAIRQEVERGTPLREARQRLGYHTLQTRSELYERPESHADNRRAHPHAQRRLPRDHAAHGRLPLHGPRELFRRQGHLPRRHRFRDADPRLTWDTCISAFAGRQALYEYYFFGDPVRMAGAYVASYDREPYKARVQAFLERS